MAKFRWNESMSLFRDHVDPEKEEQLKWIMIEVDTKVKKIVKIVKGINSGNRETNQKKRSEVIHLVEDFHKQYQSLCALYEDLKEGVKRKCNNEEDKEDSESSPSPSSSFNSLSLESAGYYSPGSGSKTPSLDRAKVITTDGQSMKSENSCYSLEDSEVVKEALRVEHVSSSYRVEERGSTVEKLMKETGYLRDKLGQNLGNKSSAKIKELEDRFIALKLEIEALNYENCEHEEESKSRHDEVYKRRKENSNSRFPYRVSDFELAFKDKEGDYLKKLDECEKILNSKIDKSLDRVQNLQMEVDLLRSQNDEKEKDSESLRIQIRESEMELEKKTKDVSDECEKILKGKIEESMDRVHNLQIKVDYLRSLNDEAQMNFIYEKEKELKSLRIQNKESEMELKKKTREAMDSLELLESLTEKLKQQTKNEEDLVVERNSLKKRVKDLEAKIRTINDESRLSKYENEKQRTTISQLEEELQEKKGQISSLESKIKSVKRDLSNKMKSVEQKLKLLETDKKELAATLEQRDMMMSKLNNEAKASFQTSVKKMVEMVDEFKKKSEDSIRILSRRIRVAEQLHNETRDWYKKTKEKFEQDQRDNELALRTIKLVMTKVSDTLTVSETLGVRFTECCEDFANRVSKVSCGINFAKNWVKRKNGAMVQAKEDFDELLVQLDDKEEEILGSRQKVLKLESKLRDLETTLKENGVAMIALKEEKREAIRQLCVWTDYHRNRSDYLKKAFTELLARNQRQS